MKFLLYGANGHTAAFAIEYAKEQGITLSQAVIDKAKEVVE